MGLAGRSGSAPRSRQASPDAVPDDPGEPGESIMRLRKLLLATGAIVAAGAIALAPAAQATTPGMPIATVSVGGSTANTTHPINLTMKSAQVKTKAFGIPLTINCTAGASSGYVNGGMLGQPSPEMVLHAMSLTCPSIIPGTTVTMAVT